MSTHVCAHTRKYVCVYACTYSCAHTCAYAYTYVHICVHLHTHTHIHTPPDVKGRFATLYVAIILLSPLVPISNPLSLSIVRVLTPFTQLSLCHALVCARGEGGALTRVCVCVCVCVHVRVCVHAHCQTHTHTRARTHTHAHTHTNTHIDVCVRLCWYCEGRGQVGQPQHCVCARRGGVGQAAGAQEGVRQGERQSACGAS